MGILHDGLTNRTRDVVENILLSNNRVLLRIVALTTSRLHIRIHVGIIYILSIRTYAVHQTLSFLTGQIHVFD